MGRGRSPAPSPRCLPAWLRDFTAHPGLRVWKNRRQGFDRPAPPPCPLSAVPPPAPMASSSAPLCPLAQELGALPESAPHSPTSLARPTQRPRGCLPTSTQERGQAGRALPARALLSAPDEPGPSADGLCARLLLFPEARQPCSRPSKLS